jgi:acylglycerol lipase
VADLTFKRKDIHEQVKNSVVYFQRLPRLATAANMLFTSLSIADQLEQLRLPFLICHGADDRVCDPKMSQRMYDEASSADKTIKLYPGAWHALLVGEEEPTASRVRNDIIQWLEERTTVQANGKR